MKAKNTFLALLVVTLVALAGVFLTTQAQESGSQITLAQKFVKSGPQASGAGVLQVAPVNTGVEIAVATLTQIVAAPASGSIYVDGIFLEKATATTGTVTLRYGTGTNCGTGTTTLIYVGPQTTTSLMPLGYYPMHIQVPATKALCAITDATTTAAIVLAQ